jgi:hypothetical protein
LSTKDFRDPVTRIPYTPEDIQRIQDISKALELNKLDIVDVFMNQTEQPADVTARQRLQEIQSLETCLGEIIVDMLKIIEKRITPAEAQLRLSMLFSEFETPFCYMKSLDIEAAYVNLMSWMGFLRGPQKKPTSNPSSGLQIAINFLRGENIHARYCMVLVLILCYM